MKRDFSAALMDLQGTQLKDQFGKDMSFRSVSVDALLLPVRGDEMMTGSLKMQRFTLAQRIQASGGECELDSEDISLIKLAVSQAYPSPLIYGLVTQWLEADPAPPVP